MTDSGVWGVGLGGGQLPCPCCCWGGVRDLRCHLLVMVIVMVIMMVMVVVVVLVGSKYHSAI